MIMTTFVTSAINHMPRKASVNLTFVGDFEEIVLNVCNSRGDAFNICATTSQFFFESFKTAIEVIDTIDRSFALGH